MSAKLKNSPSIPITRMNNGQIGVVTDWPYNKHCGKIVQRVGIMLIIIGSDDYYPAFFTCSDKPEYKATILPEGTEIIL